MTNLKTVVDVIFVGKGHQINRRFLALANHYLFEQVACTPESEWEKGQVENQVGDVREWLFTPTPRFAGFAELNAWLPCVAKNWRAQTSRTKRTYHCWAFYRRATLMMPIKAVFDGYAEKTLRVSSTCLVNHNHYSAPADWANRVESVRIVATRLRIVTDGQIIANHDSVKVTRAQVAF